MATPVAVNTAAILVNKGIKQRKSRRTGRSLAIALIIGFVFVIVGIIPIATFNPTPFAGPPTCNGETMNPGDTCVEYTNGQETGSYDYDQMLAGEQPDRGVNYGWGFSLIAVGVLTIGLGAYNYNPKRPWGKARVEPCPKCGQQHLREKLMSYQRSTGYRKRTTWRSNVVLCDETCGFVTLYKPGANPVLHAGVPQ
jgi:hypothetical protein